MLKIISLTGIEGVYDKIMTILMNGRSSRDPLEETY